MAELQNADGKVIARTPNDRDRTGWAVTTDDGKIICASCGDLKRPMGAGSKVCRVCFHRDLDRAWEQRVNAERKGARK